MKRVTCKQGTQLCSPGQCLLVIKGKRAVCRICGEVRRQLDGTEGQDRKSYTDDQDRKSYTTKEDAP